MATRHSDGARLRDRVHGNLVAVSGAPVREEKSLPAHVGDLPPPPEFATLDEIAFENRWLNDSVTWVFGRGAAGHRSVTWMMFHRLRATRCRAWGLLVGNRLFKEGGVSGQAKNLGADSN